MAVLYDAFQTRTTPADVIFEYCCR